MATWALVNVQAVFLVLSGRVGIVINGEERAGDFELARDVHLFEELVPAALK